MSADPSRLEVYCLDVGQGDCTVVVPPEGEGDPILFDCNDAYVAERFLANHRVKALQAVVVSHLDEDHIRGVLPFLQQHFAQGGTVRQLVLGLDRPRETQCAAALLDAALAWAETPPCAGFSLAPPFHSGAPVRLARGRGWSVELISPGYDAALAAQRDAQRSNSASVVLRIQRAGTAVLVGGDAELGSWERLSPEQLSARVIRVPHHGGEIGAPADGWRDFSDLYQAVGANRAVVSVGTHNRHGHPLPEHLRAMRRGQQCRVLCTQMTAQCHGDPAKVRDEALRATGLEYPYRHRAVPGYSRSRTEEVPCAGTVLISLDAEGKVTVAPRPAAHGALLDALDHPLCRG